MAAKTPVSTKLFVGGLPMGCSQSELHSLFSRYGKVAECDIVKDFGFIHYDDANEARAAVAALDNSQFNGSTIKVQISHSRVRQKPGMGAEGRCYRCGGAGHWTKECPMQSREGRSRPSPSYRRPASDRESYGYGDVQAAVPSYGGYAPPSVVRASTMSDWGAQYGIPAPATAAPGPYVDRYHPYAVRASIEQRRPEPPPAAVVPAVSAYAAIDEYGRPAPEFYTQRYYSSLAETTYAVPQGNPSRY